MTNKLKLFILLFFVAGSVAAQQGRFKLGLRFAPGVSMTRVEDSDKSDPFEFSSSAAGVRFSAGVSGDFYFGRNYAVYSGIWYTNMKSGIKGSYTPAAGSKSTVVSEANIQNIQIPAALKFFTNEIATDAKLYFVIGGTGSIAIKKIDIADDAITGDKFIRNDAADAYTIGDVGLLAGAGVEYRLGESTSLYGGLSYNRGFADVATKKGPVNVNPQSGKDYEAASLYNISLSMISLEMGVYF